MKLGDLEIKFEKRDIWVGLYWTATAPELLLAGWNSNIPVASIRTVTWYFCPVPCLVFIKRTRHVTLLPQPK